MHTNLHQLLLKFLRNLKLYFLSGSYKVVVWFPRYCKAMNYCINCVFTKKGLYFDFQFRVLFLIYNSHPLFSMSLSAPLCFSLILSAHLCSSIFLSAPLFPLLFHTLYHSYHYCQAQPKPQLNWAELALMVINWATSPPTRPSRLVVMFVLFEW